MPSTPLELPCPHLATPQEQRRDPAYAACTAAAGQPCLWAIRYDGLPNPPFHTERLEAAALASTPTQTLDSKTFQETVLNTGLI